VIAHAIAKRILINYLRNHTLGMHREMIMDKSRKNQNIFNSSFTLPILSKLFNGYRPAQIADQLGITPQAVNYHTDNMIDAGLIRKDKGNRTRWVIEDKGLFILKQKLTGSVNHFNIHQTARPIPTRLDNLAFEFKVQSPIPSNPNLSWREIKNGVSKCSLKYNNGHSVELVKSENGSVMIIHLDRKYCFDWFKELVNQYNLAIHYARQAAVQFRIEVSEYGKLMKRPHIAFEEDLIALLAAASHTAEIKTAEKGKAWIDSSSGLGELETNNAEYAYHYLMMPETIERIAHRIDLTLKYSNTARYELSYHPFLTVNN
jgi:hypothetical protein